MNYGRFFAMIATSTVVMFGLMYLNTYALDHIFFSQTRMWMAIYMGAVMAIIMLAFMLGMYSNKKVDFAIFAGAAAAFALLHGRWIEAGLAGVIFSMLYIRQGRLADAITAHAVANALIAVVAAWRGDWTLI